MFQRSLGDLTWPAVATLAEQPAVIAGDVVISYGDLDARMNRFANALIHLGVRKGDRVAFLFGNEPRFLEVFFGAMRMGAVSVPLNVRLADDTLRVILQDAGVTALAVSSALSERGAALAETSGGVEILIFDGALPTRGYGLGALLEQASDRHPGVSIAADDLCMMPFTSGSTGHPKGILLTHGGQLWNAHIMRKLLMVDENERTLVAIPLYHKHAMAGAVKPFLLGGGTLVILPEFEPEAAIAAMSRHRCTYLRGVPAMFRLLAAHQHLLERYGASSLRWAVSGAAPAHIETLLLFEERFKTPISESYGLTEGGVVTETPRWGIRRHGSAGLPLPGCEIRLCVPGRPDERVDPGQVGELTVRNPGVAKGYYKLPDLTKQRFTGDGWLRTGDLVKQDEDGYVYIVGRTDDMINVGGEHVYPRDVENLLQRHPAVADVAVVSAPHPLKGAAPVAFVVRKSGVEVSEEDLKRFALTRGPAFAHPRRVYFLERLPVAGTGKVDKAALQAQVPPQGRDDQTDRA